MRRMTAISTLLAVGALCCVPAQDAGQPKQASSVKTEVAAERNGVDPSEGSLPGAGPPAALFPGAEAPVEPTPRVAHVVVALCDNVHQGIVPVPPALGDGDDLGGNLYWGALYGVKTFFSQKAGWTVLATEQNPADHLLQRVIFHTTINRHGANESVYVVADAWRGRRIKEAIEQFLEMSAGRQVERIDLLHQGEELTLVAGGGAQMVAYVGHDGLMEFSLPSPLPQAGTQPPGAIVLACMSKQFFGEHLRSAGAAPQLLTTGLMAPEAYTLDAALRAFFAGDSAADVREAAARAYDQYQRCGLGAARGLFWASE